MKPARFQCTFGSRGSGRLLLTFFFSSSVPTPYSRGLMGLKMGHLRVSASSSSWSLSLKNLGQQLKRMYSAIPEAVKESLLRFFLCECSKLLSSLLNGFAASLSYHELLYLPLLTFKDITKKATSSKLHSHQQKRNQQT